MRKTLLRAASAAALATLSASLLTAAPAGAGGLYFSDRGVRPLGRAGAFIAGADDLGAIAYNPAGMFDAGTQVLVDGSWLHFTSDYTRQANLRQIDPNTGATVGTYKQTFDPVRGTTPFLPIPTLAASFQPHRQWVVGFGIWAPYAALVTYPEEVKNKPAPQRYSLLSLDGSLLAVVAAGVSFAPTKEWRIGATAQMLTGKFATRAVFSGCVPETFFCAPEDPNWDVHAQLDVAPIFAPSGQLGAIWIPSPAWRAGVSVQLPYFVRAPATVKVRLPSAPVFERASVEGDQGHVAFDLPWNIKVGVETRVVEDLRLELSLGYERWGMHDAIHMTPDKISLRGVTGFPKDYYLPPIELPRNFKDSFSAHLGGEYAFQVKTTTLQARAGVSFDSSAVPKEYLSALTVDMHKVTTALGGSIYIGKARIDVMYAHVFGITTTVDPADAKITQVVPVRSNAPRHPDYINGGVYAARADALGLGFAYTFEPAPVPDAPPPASPTP